MNLSEKLTNVRRATRLLATYFRRISDILKMIESCLQEQARDKMKIWRWQPMYGSRIGKQSVSPASRPGWDFLPLHNTWVIWSTDGKNAPQATGSIFVRCHHVTDSGFPADIEDPQPDPANFAPAEETLSELRFEVVVLARGTCRDEWSRVCELHADSVGAASIFDNTIRNVEIDPLDKPSKDAVLRHVGWRVNLTELETADDVERLVLEPLRTYRAKLVAEHGA